MMASLGNLRQALARIFVTSTSSSNSLTAVVEAPVRVVQSNVMVNTCGANRWPTTVTARSSISRWSLNALGEYRLPLPLTFFVIGV